ncbi:probable inactive receptor kinase At5g67200 [Abrus precatorius]|uniref:Probable inactive receptor kinase At5g67200 n=1 Tax=Abrus precatorius TaxID=3816 RepID=A0A8B8LDA6_ABRPR|nr:probable inactive receptor kinase At5g67200 [Abrus precatorius]
MPKKKKQLASFIHQQLLLILFLLLLASGALASKLARRHLPPLVFADASALLAFKVKADVNKHLDFSPTTRGLRFCAWEGVECNGAKVVRLVLQGLDLGGVWAPNTLSRLDQLRVLSLQNNSLIGPIPDLTGLFNLKSLFLDNNHFIGSLPPSLFILHRLRTLDFSHNNLTGSISTAFTNLDRLHCLRLSWNHFNGSIPPFNQSSLRIFDVSGNNLSGAIPVTPALFRFQASSFAFNPGLCGEIIRKECRPAEPFFGPSSPPAAGLGQSAQVHGVNGLIRQPYEKKRRDRRAMIIGFSAGVFVLIVSLVCFAAAVRKQRCRSKKEGCSGMMASDAAATAEAAAVMQMELERELEEKVKRAEVAKSGSLVFCAGEAQVYTLEQLMKGSAELLGRGCLGTTYKAVLDNRLIVTVKRLDATKMAAHATKEVFERHMEAVGGLRHPNLIALRAYFQAKQERLIIYDFQPNGSLFSLIHGSRSSRARPLHWTSCLKIAEDVAQGLSFIHQAWRLVHGNLKSSNVLLGPDFEACLTDYCLSVLTHPAIFDEDGDSAAYRAPETRNPNHHPTHKSDVYAYGILLLELLTGKYPSELPFLVPGDMSGWVRSIRDDNGGDDSRMDMLLQVATTCSLTSPEQRPTMWQVLKMLQEIKDIVLLEDSSELDLRSSNAMH